MFCLQCWMKSNGSQELLPNKPNGTCLQSPPGQNLLPILQATQYHGQSSLRGLWKLKQIKMAMGFETFWTNEWKPRPYVPNTIRKELNALTQNGEDWCWGWGGLIFRADFDTRHWIRIVLRAIEGCQKAASAVSSAEWKEMAVLDLNQADHVTEVSWIYLHEVSCRFSNKLNALLIAVSRGCEKKDGVMFQNLRIPKDLAYQLIQCRKILTKNCYCRRWSWCSFLIKANFGPRHKF